MIWLGNKAGILETITHETNMYEIKPETELYVLCNLDQMAYEKAP